MAVAQDGGQDVVGAQVVGQYDGFDEQDGGGGIEWFGAAVASAPVIRSPASESECRCRARRAGYAVISSVGSRNVGVPQSSRVYALVTWMPSSPISRASAILVMSPRFPRF